MSSHIINRRRTIIVRDRPPTYIKYYIILSYCYIQYYKSGIVAIITPETGWFFYCLRPLFPHNRRLQTNHGCLRSCSSGYAISRSYR